MNPNQKVQGFDEYKAERRRKLYHPNLISLYACREKQDEFNCGGAMTFETAIPYFEISLLD